MSKQDRIIRQQEDLGPFIEIPHAVLKSQAYRKLSGISVKLLIELLLQNSDKNNGHLHLSFPWLEKRGWTSKGVIQRAKDNLIESGLIVCTKQGGFNAGPSLYAVTWLDIETSYDAGKEASK